LTIYDAAAIKRITKEIDMKLALQIVGIVVLLGFVGATNIWHNNYKRDNCLDMGGRFVLNTSDSNQSTCILGN